MINFLAAGMLSAAVVPVTSYEPSRFGDPELVIVTPEQLFYSPSSDGRSGAFFYRQTTKPDPLVNVTVQRLMQVSLSDGTARQVTPEPSSTLRDFDLHDTYLSHTGRYLAYRIGDHPSSSDAYIADLTDGSIRRIPGSRSLDNTISNFPPVINFAPDDSRVFLRYGTTYDELWGAELSDPTLTPVQYAPEANSTPWAYLSDGRILHNALSSSSNRWLGISDSVTREQRAVLPGVPVYALDDLHVSPDESFVVVRKSNALHYASLSPTGPAPVNLIAGMGSMDLFHSWLQPGGQYVYFMGTPDGGWNDHLYRTEIASGNTTRLTDAIPTGGDMNDGALAFYQAANPQDSRYYFTSSYDDLDILFEGRLDSDAEPVQVATLFQYGSTRPHNTFLEVSDDGGLLLATKRDYSRAIAVDLETGQSYEHIGLSSSNYAIDLDRKLIYKSVFLRDTQWDDGYAVVVQPLDGSVDAIPLLFNDVRNRGFGIKIDQETGKLIVFDGSTYEVGFETYILDVSGTFLTGDLNGDWRTDNADISALVMALTDSEGFSAAYSLVDRDLIGDFTGDGMLTIADIDGFAELLAGGNAIEAQTLRENILAQVNDVPEPSSIALMSPLALMLVRRRGDGQSLVAQGQGRA